MSFEEEAKELIRKFKLQHKNTFQPSQESPDQSPPQEGHIPQTPDQSPIPIQKTNTETIQPTNPELDISNIVSNLPLNSNLSEGTEQGLLQNQNINTQVIIPPQPTGPHPPSSMPTGNTCKECKMIHPRLKLGEKCPNVIPKELTDSGMDDIIVSKFLVNIRNIIVSQVSKKEIKDGKKFFQFAIVELMKILEGYSE